MLMHMVSSLLVYYVQQNTNIYGYLLVQRTHVKLQIHNLGRSIVPAQTPLNTQVLYSD